ncbi:hypothetical protein MKEN_00859700 [Mycena kentingensis (nom. inval.)]|nr:hypothetical protein MKEN_00859700 [Mycena kentingensis (nom. inval.)]
MSSNSKGDVSSEKLDTPIVEKAHLLWTQPFLNALYDFITFFSPEDATPPASDSNLTDRFWGIVLRLFFLILLAPFPLSPSERSPNSVSPSTLAQVKYPLLLFAVANTRQNCGDSLPLYHSILALGILFCSFVGDYSSWENISIENVGPAVLLGAVDSPALLVANYHLHSFSSFLHLQHPSWSLPMMSTKFRRIYCLLGVLALHAAAVAALEDAKAESDAVKLSVEAETPAPVQVEYTTARTVPLEEATTVLEALAEVVESAVEAAEAVPEPTVDAAETEATMEAVAEEQTTPTPTPTPEAATHAHALEEDLSAASVAMHSAHGMESAVVEEIVGAVEDAQAPLVVETPEAASPAAEGVEEPLPEADPLPEEDEDLSEFLGDLGIVEQQEVEEDDGFLKSLGFADEIPIYEEDDWQEDDDGLSPEERIALQRQQEEEQREAKIRKTKEKRAYLEGAMAKSLKDLGEMAKKLEKELRRMLVQTRKTAAAKLQDETTAVGGAIPALKEEGEKLLKGLEGYLKKASKGQGEDRINKWYGVVQKLEEKLSEKVGQAQSVLHQFHAQTKNTEAERGMDLIEELKSACGQAQADVGLDLSWLDDVTYMDWQVYHDIARIGERFQAEASEIQAGTHAHPPVDPFMAQLAVAEQDLTNYVNQMVERIEALKGQAETVLRPRANPPVAEKQAHDEL